MCDVPAADVFVCALSQSLRLLQWARCTMTNHTSLSHSISTYICIRGYTTSTPLKHLPAIITWWLIAICTDVYSCNSSVDSAFVVIFFLVVVKSIFLCMKSVDNCENLIYSALDTESHRSQKAATETRDRDNCQWQLSRNRDRSPKMAL